VGNPTKLSQKRESAGTVFFGGVNLPHPFDTASLFFPAGSGQRHAFVERGGLAVQKTTVFSGHT